MNGSWGLGVGKKIVLIPKPKSLTPNKKTMIKDYKDLRIWQQGMELVEMVYIEMKNMPKEELYGLTNQIKRAAVSVPSNIAEGHSRGTKEFIRFLRIAQGSLVELETQLILTIRLKMLEETKINPLLNHLVGLKKQIHTLKRKLKEKL